MSAVPTPAPPIRPGLRMLAIVGALLVHVPPGVEHASNMELPTHMPNGPPVIAAGPAFTVTVFVT